MTEASRWGRARRDGAQARTEEPRGRLSFSQRLLDDPKGTAEQELGSTAA